MNPTASMHAFFESAGSEQMVLVLAGGLVAIAALVNRFAPDRRSAVRRSLTWFALYLAFALATAFAASAPTGLQRFLAVNSDLFQAFTIVNLLSTLVFDLGLRPLGFARLRITSDLVTGGAYLFALAAVLSTAGLDLGSVLAASTAAAAILTISLQSTLGNLVGGVALQLEGSVKVGDWIRLDEGHVGRVAEVHWRHTLLETRDFDAILVPNALLLQGRFVLLGRREGRDAPHREWVAFHVDRRHAPAEVCDAVATALLASPIPNVAPEPPLDVVCTDLATGSSLARYAVRFHLVDLGPDLPTASHVRARIHAALRRAGIPLAHPTESRYHLERGTVDKVRAERRLARARQALRTNRLFQPLLEEELDTLAGQLRYAPFDAGELIVRQGKTARWLYVLASGSVEVVTEVDGARRRVATLHGPDVFGEMGLLTGEPRMASVFALTPVVCHRLPRDAFEAVLRSRPALADRLAGILVERQITLKLVRDELSAEAGEEAMDHERGRILDGIRSFFGLS